MQIEVILVKNLTWKKIKFHIKPWSMCVAPREAMTLYRAGD